MEAKKTPKADLEKRRGLYLEIGLVVILALALVAFNIKSYDKEVKEVNTRVAESEIDAEVLNTPPEELPPPPPPEQEIVATDLKVVENDEQPINEVGLINADDNANKAQETFVKVEVKEEEEVVEEEVFLVVEDDPEFPGGLSALSQYLASNIKYPQLAKENNITGKVFVSFVVEKDGSVGQVKILRDIGGGCGAEAVRVVKSMPKWKPGKQRGKPVRTQFNLPVDFSLN
ncbi:MAG: TonB family protein [Bacteroidales bacterium]|jgi:protein TonB|nr:TonB family protein [Bacteroidales bacterium]